MKYPEPSNRPAPSPECPSCNYIPPERRWDPIIKAMSGNEGWYCSGFCELAQEWVMHWREKRYLEYWSEHGQ